MLSFTIGQSSISVFLDGVFNSIDTTHANFPLLLAELQKAPADRDLAAIRTYITIKSLIEHLSIGRVSVFEDEIQFDGRTVHNYLAERMLEFLNQGIDLTPWATFMDNVYDNPATYAQDELYQWLEKAQMPITPDGCFLAFKKVRSDYTDCHTGKFDNSPGSRLEMDRDACDTDRNRTCSTGFHFCSIGYIGAFGGQRVVVVKIDPKDVTSIPVDYAYTKGRCWKYEVVGELDKQSAAYDSFWRKGLVDLENPAELPAGVLSNINLPSPVLNEPVQAISDPTDAEDLRAIISNPAITIQPKNCWVPQNPIPGEILLGIDPGVETACASMEDGMIDAGNADVIDTAPSTRVQWEQWDAEGMAKTVASGHINVKDADEYIEKCRARYDTIFDERGELHRPAAAEPTPEQAEEALEEYHADALDELANEGRFTTVDGREFSADMIKQALEDASIRGAARNLGIQDSTLRGWKKKLGL